MSKKGIVKVVIIALAALLAVGFGYYYVVLPPINIHAPGFWLFVIVLSVVLTAVVGLAALTEAGAVYNNMMGREVKKAKYEFKSKATKNVFKLFAFITVTLVVIFIIGSILSSEIVNASKYQQLLNVETRNFADDIKEVSYDQIPLLDKDSAATIGNRVMGTMVDMVSQFEVSDLYTQINYQNKPVRVSPLQYGSLIKWFSNKSSGIPGYIRIDMTTQQAECVRLEEGIKYSMSDHFGRNIYRHLRFAYPTYIFDDLNFEIDENGTPYWICPVKKYNIGLFGGVTIGRVVLCNAVTGEMTDYAVEDVPEWVDKVFKAELLIELYDYYGTLRHGFLNSVLSQKDCLVTTEGYNYIALEDDVWVYTGITSVGQDESNVGFVLMNQRTMETRYYVVSGAEEYSAMSSAEGKVQHLGYSAAFPLLINVGGEPTYFMALKDSSGLVKCYAMLNIEKYQTVAIGDSVSECESNYRKLMADSGILTESEPKRDEKKASGKIEKIIQTVIDGNSHFYVLLEGRQELFDVSVAELVDIVRYNVGDSVTFTYYEEGNAAKVTQLK
ncbi:MAG: CvpA family protein [Lachnospira sp.]|nr:CvpA family protein [Lachnospira sp.]